MDPVLNAKYVPHDNFALLRIKALTFLAHCSRLRRSRPEKGGITLNRHHHVIPLSVALCLSHPEGFQQLKRALDSFVSCLSDHFRINWQWDEGDDVRPPGVSEMSNQSATVHCLIGCCYLQLWNVRSLRDENVKAVLVARRLVNFISHFGPATVSRRMRRDRQVESNFC